MHYVDTSADEILTATAKEAVINKWNGETSEKLKKATELQQLEKWTENHLMGSFYDKRAKKQTQRTGRGW